MFRFSGEFSLVKTLTWEVLPEFFAILITEDAINMNCRYTKFACWKPVFGDDRIRAHFFRTNDSDLLVKVKKIVGFVP